MPSQLDLDQGGTFRQTQSVYLGPSIGWVTGPVTAILPITVAGTTTVLPGNSLITVNVNAAVTVQLPAAKSNSAGQAAVPGQALAAAIIIVDIGGFAAAHPITILPAGAETIDGQASISLSSAFGAFSLQPNVISGGWTLIQ
jgi:hypothetical protein